jgi:hypothetical protein
MAEPQKVLQVFFEQFQNSFEKVSAIWSSQTQDKNLGNKRSDVSLLLGSTNMSRDRVALGKTGVPLYVPEKINQHGRRKLGRRQG